MNPFDLPTDRLATADSQGNRIYLYPGDVSGRYRKRRLKLNVVLVLIFLLLPWVRIRGYQSVLLDIAHRRFAIFGITFWAHDAPLLIFIFGGGAVLLALITALYGRVWCGWACPQTVFVDGLFRGVERWIEGNALQRRKLDQSQISREKILKKTLKWGLFSILSILISHSFLAYFIGTEELEKMMTSSPLTNMGSFIVALGATLFILFDFGWFREQFCTLVCPYGRFQSVLMDDHSQVIAYDALRGEPRRNENLPKDQLGDCVNCYRCVQVCPTGIDIRRGVQLECIACTSCIDACDEVMKRLNKPRGLIRYDHLLNSKAAKVLLLLGVVKQDSILRPRIIANGLILLVFVLGLIWILATRNPIELALIRAVDVPYQELVSTEGKKTIINHFKVELRNQSFLPQKVDFRLPPELSSQSVQLILSNHNELLGAGESERVDLFLQFPEALLDGGRATIFLKVEIPDLYTALQEVTLIGPIH